MTQPRWMQGAPVDDENKPRWMQGEVVSEGSYQEPYGASTMHDFGVAQTPVPTDPQQLSQLQSDSRVPFMDRKERFLAGIPAPEQPDKMGRLSSAGIGYADSTTLGNYAENEGAAAAYPTYSKNGAGMLAGLADKAGVLPEWAGGGKADQADQFEKGFEQLQSKAMEDNPLSYLGGELAGYFVPGGAAWKGAGSLTKSLPGAQSVANTVGKMGRIPSYFGRMATSGAGFTADAALHGATVGASREEAATGQKFDVGQRAQLAKDYAFANAGDVADGFGVEIPSVLRGVPIAPVMPVAGSVVERGIKGLGSGGKMITPDRIQAQVLQNTGRAPSPNSTAAAMAEVLPAERITSGTVKTFRFIENALRNGLKDAGLTPADITRRVTRGFNRIHESIPALADGRTTLAQIVEREFADAGPQVSENLRLFLLRVGLDDPAVTRGVIDEMRTGQVKDFRQAVDENFGAQNTYTAETEIREGLNKLGQGFDQVLDKARQQSNNSPLSHSLREQLKQTDMKFELKADASRRGWKDVDTFIDQDPWQAGHVLQSKLAKLAENAAGSGSAAYSKFREPVVWIKEILNEVPGYKQMADTYAKEATVLDTLGHTKKVGSKEVTTPGFGPQLRKDARRARDVARRADEFGQMPDRQQDAAMLSTGEVLKDQMRTARPGGTNLEGQDLLGLRLTDLQNEGMMSTNADMPGALPAVFGEAGERVSQKVDDIVNSRKFLADIDPKTGSNTVNKANAQMSGDSVVTSGLPRTMTSGYTQAGLIDATMFASGLPPVATMLTKGIPALGRVLGPGKKTRAEIAQALLQRPARQAAPPPSPGSIPPMSGRNRPRAWRNDDKWGDPNLSNPQLASSADGPTPSAAVAASQGKPVAQNGLPNIVGAPARTVAGGVGGGVYGWNNPSDWDGDGEISLMDRGRSVVPSAIGGAVAGRQLPKVAKAYMRGLDDSVSRSVRTTRPDSVTPKQVRVFDRIASDQDFDKALRAISDEDQVSLHMIQGQDDLTIAMELESRVRDQLVAQRLRPDKAIESWRKKHIRKEIRDQMPPIEASTRARPTAPRFEPQGRTPSAANDAASTQFDNITPLNSPSDDIISNGIPGTTRKDALRQAREASGGSFPAANRPPPGGPVVPPRPASEVPLHLNEQGLREDLIKTGVVGTALGAPTVGMLYNWYAAEQYQNNKPAMSMKEFMQALEAAQRQQQGVPPTPSLKPPVPAQ